VSMPGGTTLWWLVPMLAVLLVVALAVFLVL
jgi:hypothetical protein